MFNVICTLENGMGMEKIDPKGNYKPLVVMSVDIGENVGRDVIIKIGNEIAKVNAYELREAIKNCGSNGMIERDRGLSSYRPRYKLEYVADDNEDDENEENNDDA